MKITIYELLGMVKDGKLMPERIKFENYIYIWRNTQKDYFCEQINHSLESIIGEYLFSNLNLEVEILEEEKKIPKKIQWHEDNGVGDEDDAFYVDVNNKSQYVHSEYDSWEMTVILTINKIIDYLKSKGE